jgi:beta-lactamase superfamily II metal-dependent hydrolase
MNISRRDFLSKSSAAAFMGAVGGCTSFYGEDCYPGWKIGEMDIHFIHTGQSESTFFIFPDGTTMLLDCGYVKERKAGYAEALPVSPSAERRSGEWIRRYMEKLIPQREIDYLMISHWHSDHVNGLPDILESFRFKNYYDHQFPNFGKYSVGIDPESFDFVNKWLPGAQKDGMKVNAFKVGAKNQLCLQHDPRKYYQRVFEIRNLAANGSVWDGKNGVRDLAAIHVKKTGKDKIYENLLSSAIRIRYGNFTYFTGGDIEGKLVDADGKEFSYEEEVGKITGKVCACKTNHHACPPSMREGFLRSLQPKLILSSTWSPNQINEVTLERMSSRDIYPGERTIAYGQLPDFKKGAYADKAFMRDIAPEGHAVIKVVPGGFAYRLYTLTTKDESMRIVGTKDFYCC